MSYLNKLSHATHASCITKIQFCKPDNGHFSHLCKLLRTKRQVRSEKKLDYSNAWETNNKRKQTKSRIHVVESLYTQSALSLNKTFETLRPSLLPTMRCLEQKARPQN